MREIDTVIYNVVKKSLGFGNYSIYDVEANQFTDVSDLLDFGREIRYNSNLSHSENIFIDDELGALKYAYEKNTEVLKNLVAHLNAATANINVTTNTSSEDGSKSVSNTVQYVWKLVRLNKDGIIKLCKRQSGETKVYKDSIFITDEEKNRFTAIASYNNHYHSHITTEMPEYTYWSKFIDDTYGEFIGD